VNMWTARIGSIIYISGVALVMVLFAHGSAEAQAPPNSTFCANDFQPCNFDGEREVIYGANGVFVRKVIKGGSVCLPVTFGVDDPVPNVLKSCYVVNPPIDKVVRTTKPQPAADAGTITRTITVKNNAGFNVNPYLFQVTASKSRNQRAKIGWMTLGETKVLGDGVAIPAGDLAELEFEMDNGDANNDVKNYVFRAILPSSQTAFCYEVVGTYLAPFVKTCDGSPSYESKYISFKNEAGYNGEMSLTYYPVGQSAATTFTTFTTTPGYQRKIYLPVEADTAKPMTLNVIGGSDTLKTQAVSLDTFDSSGSTCYKVWGSIFSKKVSPCSANTSARTIKLKNNGAFQAAMSIGYDDNGTTRYVKSNPLELLESDTVEVPYTSSKAPITLRFLAYNKEFNSATVPGNFTGELCYKLEGTAFAPTSATCDDTVGDTTDPNTRQIRFQNEAGFDASMIVTYFEDQVINGVTIQMPKTLATGMINGLGGKFRLVTIPRGTSKGMPITIAIQGNATFKNDVYSTTLPANFAASPQPCFKVWGTAFDPQGGKCDQ
jgi:hypothetical protein